MQLKCKYVIFLPLLLAYNFCLSEETKNIKIDSLKQLLNNSVKDTNKVLLVEKIADEYLKINDSKKALEYFNVEKQIATDLLNVVPSPLPSVRKMLIESIVFVDINIGTIYENQADYIKAMDIFLKALEFSQKSNYKKGQARILNHVGNVYYYKGDYAKALSYFFQSLKISESINNIDDIAYSYNNIGNMHYKQKNWAKALEYYFKQKNIRENFPGQYGTVQALNNIGAVYYDQGDYSKAQFYFYQALNENKKSNKGISIGINLNNIGDCYFIQGNYDSALVLQKQALKLQDSIGDMEGKATSLIAIGEIYLKKANYNLAIKYVNEGLKIAYEINVLEYIRNGEELLSKAYEQQNESNKSLEHYKLFIKARDSLINVETTRKIMQAEMNYVAEKNESKINLLEKDKALFVAQRERDEWIKDIYLSILIFAVILFLGVLLYVRTYRAKQKLNAEVKVIELEQKLLRSQMNPHFIFNSLGIIRKYIQKNNSTEADTYLLKFSKLMRLILENSRFEFVTFEKEIEALTYYLNLYQLVMHHRFSFQINIDENIDKEVTTIPPMLAQPFIENSIKHGINHLEKGEITINFVQKENAILFEVIDNGIGYSKSKELGIQDTTHISLATRIVKERLENINKSKNIAIDIQDLIDADKNISGTKVSFLIPVVYIV